MRMVVRIVLGHDGATVDMVTLVIFAHIVLFPAWRYAVVAKDRISGDEDLAFIGWVGEAFGIACHSGVEHHFAGG